MSASPCYDKLVEENVALRKECHRYRKALLWIRGQLSCTLVPRNVWVKKLHGEIFMVCQTELEP